MRPVYSKDKLIGSLFGFEDSLISTTGMVTGVAAGSQSKEVILLASLVTIAVEAVSMGAGQFLSSEASEELENKKPTTRKLLTTAIVMFSSYILGGLVPVLPIFFLAFPNAVYVSVAATLICLFALGYIKGSIIGKKPTRSALEMLTIGGVATLIGVIVGLFLSKLKF